MPTLRAIALAVLACALPHTAAAKSFEVLHRFAGTPDGLAPPDGLTLAKGVLYGVTSYGGTANFGTIFTVDPKTGAEAVIYSFAGGADGRVPTGVLLSAGGLLYGTTSSGGTLGYGTVFSFNPKTASKTILHNFGSSKTDALQPGTALIKDGAYLYGTTSNGGTSNRGTVFKVDLGTGATVILYNFTGAADGSAPTAPVIAVNGMLYGTTYEGGAANQGVVFSVDETTGVEAVVHAFSGAAQGANTNAGLTYEGGLLYGAASGGGKRCGTGYCGLLFSVDPATGEEKVLYTFKNKADGKDPETAPLFLDGLIYGTTVQGGLRNHGTVYAFNPQTGATTQLHLFDTAHDGVFPRGLAYTIGAFYGTTNGGGVHGNGVVYRLKR